MITDDRLDQLLTDLDPAREAPAVVPGTPRYERLQAAATGRAAGPNRSARRHVVRRRPLLASLAAAAAVALIALVANLLITPAPTAAAVLSAAADRLADARTGHIESTWLTKDGDRDSSAVAVGDFSGADIRFSYTMTTQRPTPQTGNVVSHEEFVAVGGQVWVNRGDSWQLDPPGEPLQPYAQASAALVKALADGVETAPTEDPGGVTSYRIHVDETARDALLAMKPGELSWFDMEKPQEVSAATITVTDGVVTGIRVEYRPGSRNVSYAATISDLGKPVTITAPVVASATTP